MGQCFLTSPAADNAQVRVVLQAFDQVARVGKVVHNFGDVGTGDRIPIFSRTSVSLVFRRIVAVRAMFNSFGAAAFAPPASILFE